MAVLRKIFLFLDRRSRLTLSTLSIALVVVVAAADFFTRPEICLTLFYLLPIGLATWFIDRRAGLAFAVLGAALWILTDIAGGRSYVYPAMLHWNMLVRFGGFVLFAFVLSAVRTKLMGESSLARRDFLTGLPNSHSFYELASQELEKAFGLCPLTLVYIDMTGFKWINHRLGYAAGDQLLCSFAQFIKEIVPRKDLVGRLGGTAFGVLLPGTGSDAAALLTDQLKNGLKQERLRHGRPVHFYISAVTYPSAPRTVAELMQEAERRIHRLKESKKDSVEIAVVEAVPALV